MEGMERRGSDHLNIYNPAMCMIGGVYMYPGSPTRKERRGGKNSDIRVIQKSIMVKIDRINPSHSRGGAGGGPNKGRKDLWSSKESLGVYFAFEISLAAFINGVSVLRGSAALKNACCE